MFNLFFPSRDGSFSKRSHSHWLRINNEDQTIGIVDLIEKHVVQSHCLPNRFKIKKLRKGSICALKNVDFNRMNVLELESSLGLVWNVKVCES